MSNTENDASLIGGVRGTALFVAAIVGPGILTLPALAAAEAGPVSLLILGGMLLFSAPVAFTFVFLNRAAPGAVGVAGYARAAFGPVVGRLALAWFRYGIPVGVPALGLIGGQYVAEATGGGKTTVLVVGTAISTVAVVMNVMRRVGSGPLPLILTTLLVVMILTTAVLVAGHFDPGNLSPFAPHGLSAVLSSALLLTWVLTGWEAVTNFTAVMRDPRRTLPRVTVVALVIVAILYAAVALPELLVLGPDAGNSAAPLAAMLKVAVGPVAALIVAALAVVIALGNSVAYVGSLAEASATPGAGAGRAGRARALAVPTLIVGASLLAAALTPVSIDELVAICAASQVPVYLVGLAAGVRLLRRRAERTVALVSTAGISLLLVAAGPYLLVPGAIGLGVLAQCLFRRSPTAPRMARVSARHPRDNSAADSRRRVVEGKRVRRVSD